MIKFTSKELIHIHDSFNEKIGDPEWDEIQQGIRNKIIKKFKDLDCSYCGDNACPDRHTLNYCRDFKRESFIVGLFKRLSWWLKNRKEKTGGVV